MSKSMIWTPLTKVALDNLTTGKLLCRVELFEGNNIYSAILDKKVVDLFSKYYNYNNYKTKEIMDLLSSSDVNEMRIYLSGGGIDP